MDHSSDISDITRVRLSVLDDVMVHRYRVTEIPKAIYQQLYRLNYGADGAMRGTLVDRRKEHAEDDYVHVATDDSGRVVGWTLAYYFDQDTEGVPFDTTEYNYEIHIWVRKCCRRNGLGTMLYQITRSFCKQQFKKEPMVFPFDKQSYDFYNAIKVPEKLWNK